MVSWLDLQTLFSAFNSHWASDTFGLKLQKSSRPKERESWGDKEKEDERETGKEKEDDKERKRLEKDR